LNKITAEFLSRSIENEYRNYRIADQKKQVTYVMLLPMLATMVFQIADMIRGDASAAFTMILGVRLAYLIVSGVGIYLVNKLSSPIGIDWTVLVWTLLTGLHVLIIDVSRPDEYVHHLMVDIVFIVFLYTVFPNQVLNQLAVGLLFSGPLIFIVVEVKTGLPAMGVFSVIATVLFVNAVGYFISRRHHMLMRREFLHHRKEKMLREELEQALAEKNDLLDEQKRSASVRSRIYSIIGHDLRNPLHGIQGFAESLINADHELDNEKAVKIGGYI
jgi:signal transduction histidine kinase